MVIDTDENDQPVFPGSGANVPLQVVRWSEQRASFVADNSTERLVIPNNAALIEISAVENCFINFGDVTVNATTTIATDGSRLFMAGVQVVPVPLDPATNAPYTHVAALRQATDGIFQVEQVT